MDPRAQAEGVWQERRSSNPGRRASDRAENGAISSSSERRAIVTLPHSRGEGKERPPDVVMPDVADHHDHAWNRD